MVGGLVWGATNGVKVNTHAIEVYVFMFYQQKKRFRSGERERESRGKEERYFLTIFGHLTNYTLVEGSVKIKEESRSREFKTLCQSHDRRGKRRRARGPLPVINGRQSSVGERGNDLPSHLFDCFHLKRRGKTLIFFSSLLLVRRRPTTSHYNISSLIASFRRTLLKAYRSPTKRENLKTP